MKILILQGATSTDRLYNLLIMVNFFPSFSISLSLSQHFAIRYVAHIAIERAIIKLKLLAFDEKIVHSSQLNEVRALCLLILAFHLNHNKNANK